MNKIVLEHYPVENLPEDIQRAVGNADAVTLTIEADRPIPLDRDVLVAELRSQKLAMSPNQGTTLDEATERVRLLRNEWEE